MKQSRKPEWQTYRFDQIATNVNVRVDNPSESGLEHYVGLEHLDSDSLKIRRWSSPSDVEATKLVFKKGDVIFGRRRAYQRKLGVAEFDGICSAHAMVLRAKQEVVLPEFLPFFLQSDVFMSKAIEISVGSLSPTINWKTLACQQFSLPPIDRQKKLASVLSVLDSAVEQYSQALTNHDVLRSSTMQAHLTGEAWGVARTGLLPSGWKRQTLGELCDLINGYGFKPNDWTEEGIPIIRIQNLNGSPNFNYFSGEVPEKYHVKNGDLLFAWAGVPGVSFGARIWSGPNAVLNQHIFRVVPKGGIDRVWLFEALNHITPEIERRAHGFKTSLLHIKRAELVKMTLITPPEEIQREISRIGGVLTETRAKLMDQLQHLRTIRLALMQAEGGVS